VWTEGEGIVTVGWNRQGQKFRPATTPNAGREGTVEIWRMGLQGNQPRVGEERNQATGQAKKIATKPEGRHTSVKLVVKRRLD
jgi:hypothetical protein